MSFDQTNNFNLLNKFPTLADKLSFNQSYTMMFSSSQFGNQTAGFYLNQVKFNFKSPLKISFTWGIQQNFNSEINQGTKLILPNFQITYQPFKNLLIHFEMNHNQYPYHQSSMFRPYHSNFDYFEN